MDQPQSPFISRTFQTKNDWAPVSLHLALLLLSIHINIHIAMVDYWLLLPFNLQESFTFQNTNKMSQYFTLLSKIKEVITNIDKLYTINRKSLYNLHSQNCINNVKSNSIWQIERKYSNIYDIFMHPKCLHNSLFILTHSTNPILSFIFFQVIQLTFLLWDTFLNLLTRIF